jgi:hypothetical protein
MECDYGPVCCGSVNVDPAMVCNGGYWATVPAGCACADVVCGR